MSIPLAEAILIAGASQHTLKRVRLNDLELTTDLQIFRAPFGTKWHKYGTGHAEPEILRIAGVVESTNLDVAKTALNALLADLPAVDVLRLGVWDLPVAGVTESVAITPTLAGWRVEVALIRNGHIALTPS